MDPAWFTSSSWCHALTLGERIATLSGERSSHSLSDEDVELGRQRIQRWRSQPPFDADSYFAQRLALDGIDEERLVHILGEPVESLHGHLSVSPAWLLELAQAFAHPTSGFISPPPGEELLGFLDVIQPLIDEACDHLFAGNTSSTCC
jgi:hypothetical protein